MTPWSTSPIHGQITDGTSIYAVTANGFVFISGELPIAPDGTKLNEASFEEQAQQVLDNVALALKGAGSSIDKLVQVLGLLMEKQRRKTRHQCNDRHATKRDSDVDDSRTLATRGR